jgi:uncharacterized protein (DUF4415 family)
MDLIKMTAKQRENYHYMADAMRRLEWDLHNHIEATSHVPTEWHEIARARHPQPTERVTVRLDKDVLRFFRSMGAGYGPRLNEVLRSYMHARLAGVLKGAETVDFYRRGQEVQPEERPMFGDIGRMLGELGEATVEEKAAEMTARVKREMHRRGAEE